jgi:lysozyme family protein
MSFWDLFSSMWRPVMTEFENPNWVMLWETCKVDPSKTLQIQHVCARILAHKDRYLKVEEATKVPWYVIACIHSRESDLNFATCLHNGDLLPGPTHHVPRGRGPFKSWEEAAIDALKYDHMTDRDYSSVPMALKACEAYNGVGYHNKNIYSPYIWAGTNHYTQGKYACDGIYSRTLIDGQLGIATLFKGLGIS